MIENIVSAEGIESARQAKFNNMQGYGWHRSMAEVIERQMDRKRIAVSAWMRASFASIVFTVNSTSPLARG
jgi:hypothetical protein